jgi:microcystin-dependent protein
MATQLQFRRGTTAQNNSFTGAAGEISIDTSSKNLRIHDGANAGGYEIIPTGTIVAYGGATAPAGWLLCDAAAISRTTYARLFAVIGTGYGIGDGTTTFNVPEMRDRFPLGKGTNNATLGATGTAAAASGTITSSNITGILTVASTTGTGTTGTGTSGGTVAVIPAATYTTVASSTVAGATVASSTVAGATVASNTGTGTTGSTTQTITVGTTSVAASAKDSSLATVVNSVNTAGHTHTIPALTVPALTVPALTIPALTVPALTIPALTIPTMSATSHTHTIPGLSIPALTIPALTVADHTTTIVLPYEVTNFIIKL